MNDILKSGVPIILASELKSCFYCAGMLPATHKEHIFNSSWGGAHKTSQLICNECNDAFSHIDGSYTPYTQFIMNAWSFKGERHKEIPIIETDDNYLLKPGAKPALKSPVLKINKRLASEELTVHLEANSKGQARRVLLDNGHIESNLGRPIDQTQREHILKSISSAQIQSEKVGGLKFSANLDMQSEYRSAVHTMLKCLAMYDPNWIISDESLDVRQFARYNVGEWEELAISISPNISIADNAKETFGVRYNSVEIYWSSYYSKIIGVLTILGQVKRAVVLNNSYHGPDAILAVVEDTYGSGKLQSRYVQFNNTIPSIPLVTVRSSKVTVNNIAEEFAKLAQNSVSYDATLASLVSELENITNERPYLDDTIIDKYRIAIELFIKKIVEITGGTVTQTEITDRLIMNGIKELNHFIGNSSENNQVQEILKRAITLTLSDFLQF